MNREIPVCKCWVARIKCLGFKSWGQLSAHAPACLGIFGCLCICLMQRTGWGERGEAAPGCWCGKGVPPTLWRVPGEPRCSFWSVLVLTLASVVSLGRLFFCNHIGTANLRESQNVLSRKAPKRIIEPSPCPCIWQPQNPYLVPEDTWTAWCLMSCSATASWHCPGWHSELSGQESGTCSSHGAVQVTAGWGSVALAGGRQLCLTLGMDSQRGLFALGLMYSGGERAQGGSPEHSSTEGQQSPCPGTPPPSCESTGDPSSPKRLVAARGFTPVLAGPHSVAV